MNPLLFAYNELLFRPLFNLLVGITSLLPAHSVGYSIIIVTILVRVLLLPSMFHQARQMQHNQAKMQALKKDLAAIQKKHQNDSAAKAQATMKLYREAGINPAAGCLPLLIQLPILIALYRVFLTGLDPETASFLYSFINLPAAASLVFWGIDLTNPNLVLAVIAGLSQLVLMRLTVPLTPTTPSADDASAQIMANMQKNMVYIFPVMTVFISLQLPAALALYWVASTVFGILQQYLFKKYFKLSSSLAV
jgi:YidC/Oxa1 family membrane protein insertase